MKKSVIYIFMMLVAAAFAASCSGYNGKDYASPNQDTTPKDTLSWANAKAKGFNVDPNTMMAYPTIEWWCTNGGLDSCKMEPWLLDINTMDLVVYRDSYQPTSKSGITPDAARSSDNEVKDKLGNLVVRHHYTQSFRFNNFDHKINGSWTTGRIFYGNGKEESYLPEDGLYYEVSVSGNTVNDTVHTVRNDSIFAIENVKLTYTATLKVDPSKPHTWLKYERTATVMVISFVGIVEHEEEIPTADFYVSNLQWYAASGNRLFKKTGENKDGDIGYWEDGFLMSTDTHYIMLIVHYTVEAKDGKSDERYNGTELFCIEKSAMATPVAGREYNAVMYDYQRRRYIPCCLSKDYNFSYGSKYADGGEASFQPDINGSVMAGVKNWIKDKDATPSPWLEGGCTPTQYKGNKNYYTITLKSSVHTNTTTVADEALKK